MPPRINLLLVRHGLSEANIDMRINMRIPDQRVPLAAIGHEQARKTGQFLSGFLSQPAQRQGRTQILCSPYLRTRQTCQEIGNELKSAGLDYEKREEIALREISFGLFDGYSDEELVQQFPVEHRWYQKHLEVEKSSGSDGEFWAAMPLGESRAQVADRVKSVFSDILKDTDPQHGNPVQNFIIVSHGVTIRAFLMQWMRHEFEWYGRQKNPGNCSVNLITSDNNRPYEHRLIFKGFEHKRATAQDRRENGKVDLAA